MACALVMMWCIKHILIILKNQKIAKIKIHRKNIKENFTSYWFTNSFNQVNARYGGSLFGKFHTNPFYGVKFQI
jgi:hypothetical protein